MYLLLENIQMQIIPFMYVKNTSCKKNLKTSTWESYACFYFLRKGNPAKHLLARLNNRFDSSDVTKGHTTKQWHELIRTLIPEHIKWEITYGKDALFENYFDIYLDLSKVNYVWALSLLTLLRYPAEYYNICYNYWKLKEKWPIIKDWDAIFLAHRGAFYKEYIKDFKTSFYIGGAHSLTGHSGDFATFNIEEIFKELDTDTTPLTANTGVYHQITSIWGGGGFQEQINFDDKDFLNNNYYFMKETE